MLNIGAKCNILSIEIARILGYIIYKVNSFIIFIAIKDQFKFARIAKIKINIAKGVNYKDLFFLVNKALKTLLRMPFISKIKMAIIYKDNKL